jgi:hypothetical protein
MGASRELVGEGISEYQYAVDELAREQYTHSPREE